MPNIIKYYIYLILRQSLKKVRDILYKCIDNDFDQDIQFIHIMLVFCIHMQLYLISATLILIITFSAQKSNHSLIEQFPTVVNSPLIGDTVTGFEDVVTRR